MGVNSVVAREAWHQPRIAGPRRKPVALWNAVVNPTCKVRSSRTVKVGLSLWRGLRKQTAVRRVCVSQGRRLLCRASGAARWNDIFPAVNRRNCFAQLRLAHKHLLCLIVVRQRRTSKGSLAFDVLRECSRTRTRHGMNPRRLHRSRAERSRAINFSFPSQFLAKPPEHKSCMQCRRHGDVSPFRNLVVCRCQCSGSSTPE